MKALLLGAILLLAACSGCTTSDPSECTQLRMEASEFCSQYTESLCKRRMYPIPAEFEKYGEHANCTWEGETCAAEEICSS